MSYESLIIDELKRQFNEVISLRISAPSKTSTFIRQNYFEEHLNKIIEDQKSKISNLDIQGLTDLLNCSNQVMAAVQSLYDRQFQGMPSYKVNVEQRKLAEKLYDFIEDEREIQKSCSRKIQEVMTKNSSSSTPTQTNSSDENKKTVLYNCCEDSVRKLREKQIMREMEREDDEGCDVDAHERPREVVARRKPIPPRPVKMIVGDFVEDIEILPSKSENEKKLEETLKELHELVSDTRAYFDQNMNTMKEDFRKLKKEVEELRKKKPAVDLETKTEECRKEEKEPANNFISFMCKHIRNNW
ncbi:hypothetical protein HZA97_00895 [Candidatus Woesearchaeota archaeon]|nr:hypothetical protein [Candidatus Woesearchaeota archaeon]